MASDGDHTNGLEERLEFLRALLAESGPGLAQVIEAFFRQAESNLAAMRHALRQEDGTALDAAAHSLAGSAALLGATNLSESAGELALLARQGDLRACSGLLLRVERDYQDAARRMR